MRRWLQLTVTSLFCHGVRTAEPWCVCMLHSTKTEDCTASRPGWLRGYTGRSGKLHFRLQDWAWGNTMMALRDALAVALVLDRRPVLHLTPSLPPLNGANLSTALELHGLDVQIEPATLRRTMQPPAGMRTVISSIADLRRVMNDRHGPNDNVYSRILLSFMKDQDRQMRALARASLGRAAWAELFAGDVPDCWPLAFIRIAARVRSRALPIAQAATAAVHLRLCSLVGWKDTCSAIRQPQLAARAVIRCALDATGPDARRVVEGGSVSALARRPPSPATLFFVASDSSEVLDSLKRDSLSGNLSLPSASPSAPGTAVPRVRVLTISGLGRTAHLSRLAGQPHEIDAQTSFDRAIFDWAIFAYSRRIVALPSSFSASAVCMFAPRDVASYIVLKRPEAAADVDCTQPFASAASGGTHPCTDVQRVNWAGPGKKPPGGGGGRGALGRAPSSGSMGRSTATRGRGRVTRASARRVLKRSMA
jgi:hypothetical protein